MEVVEVAPHLPGRLVEGGDLPTLQFRHHLGERGLLDTSIYLELLLDQLTLASRPREILPDRTNIKRAPLLGDLAL